MQSHVRSAGAHLVVVLLPSKAVVYAPTVRHHDTALAAGFSALVEQEEQVALDTTSFLRERRIDFVDVTPALRAGLERGERLYPESDDEHLNGAGYGVLAGAVAAALQPPTEPAIE
jgi:lysophospholipase L1-like esterase